MDALIGSTGFVGGSLLRQRDFDARFDSRSIHKANGQTFDTVVCAAAPGSMFEANRFPDRDREKVGSLITSLSGLKARRFVLVSTIAVLADFAADDEGSAVFQTDLAYGANRRALEVFCTETFSDCLIVRLPALFGSGLKKNFLFDILNPMPSMLGEAALDALRGDLAPDLAAVVTGLYALDPTINLFVIDREALDASGRRPDLDNAVRRLGRSAIQFTNPDSRFQYYGMDRLWADISLGLDHGLETLHLAPPPLSAGEVFQAVTGETMPDTGARRHQEDMRTRHAGLWTLTGSYIAEPRDVLDQLKAFSLTQGAGA